MAAGMINELYELVVSICDQLYASRQLITTSSVKKMVQLHGSWTEEDLELQLPTYVNQWRLQTLKRSDSMTAVDPIVNLEERVRRYRAGLLELKREIRGMLNG
jgi:hypothetical protein